MATSPFISIDVGGKAFRLMRTTIQKFPNCTVQRVATGQDTESAIVDAGTYYFDRNPDYFTVLTDFMRTGKVFLPPNLSAEMFALEAKFWGLEEALGTNAPKPPESTLVLPPAVNPTQVLDTDFRPPAGNGYQVSFGVQQHASQLAQASSHGSLTSSASHPVAGPLQGNFIGGLELKTSIEAGSLKRKNGEVQETVPPVVIKRVKFQQRVMASDEQVLAVFQSLVKADIAVTGQVTKPPVVILSGLDLNERHTITEKVKSLHGRVTETFDDTPTHLVLNEFKNTKKLLVAINKGLSVVSTRWVHESVKAGEWLQAEQFYACTQAEEQKHNFRYRETLEKARRGGFMRDATVYISPTVKPSSREFEEVVTSAGGKCVVKRPATPAAGLYIIADPKSKEAEELTSQGFLVHTSEWLCECVFRQRLA